MKKERTKGTSGKFPKTLTTLQDGYDHDVIFIVDSKSYAIKDGESIGIYELKEVKKAKVTLE